MFWLIFWLVIMLIKDDFPTLDLPIKAYSGKVLRTFTDVRIANNKLGGIIFHISCIDVNSRRD
jgi:hypothetical protein